MIIMHRDPDDLMCRVPYIDIEFGQFSTLKSTGEIVIHDADMHGGYDIVLTRTEAQRLQRGLSRQLAEGKEPRVHNPLRRKKKR